MDLKNEMLILTVLVGMTAALEVNYAWHMPLQHQRFQREHIVFYRTEEHSRRRYSEIRTHTNHQQEQKVETILR